jgi:hypothetical protein
MDVMKLCAAEPSNAIVRASTSEDPPSDVRRRMMSDYDVTLTDEDNPHDLYVMFHGPNESAYEGGTWRVHVELPEGYPYKSPSIGFCNRIFHPNVDEMCAPRRAAPRLAAPRRPSRGLLGERLRKPP